MKFARRNSKVNEDGKSVTVNENQYPAVPPRNSEENWTATRAM